tara:strand:- start:312 stop:782 length:471 start_codon:yes stop_codon:yes gene_type:complete
MLSVKKNLIKIREAVLNCFPTCSADAEYEVYIDNELVNQYSFIKRDEDYGYRDIRIELYRGTLSIDEYSAVANYPSTTFTKEIYQTKYIDWFISNTHKLGITYTLGEVIKFKHIFPQGPSLFVGDKPIFLYDNRVVVGGQQSKHLTTQMVLSNETL